MVLTFVQLPALIALLSALPPAKPATSRGCGAAAVPSDVDCCIHLALWDGQAAHPQHPSTQSAVSNERTSSDAKIR
jgi:hypothetical protein